MPAIIPANLPPEAMPWARDIVTRMQGLEADAARRAQGEINANKSQGATLGLLGQQVATLNATVATLNGQVALLNALALNQVAPAVGSDSGLGFTLGTSWSTVASFNVARPSGYTRALVFAGGSVSSATGSSVGDRLDSRIVISGGASAVSKSLMSVSTPFACVAAFGSASLSGIGSTIPVSIQAELETGPGTSDTIASVSATVIFLK